MNKFLYLNEEDMIKSGVTDMKKCIDVMEDTFLLLHQGDYRLGGFDNCKHGLRTRFPVESNIPDMPLDAPGRWFTAMPAYLGGKYHCFGFKTYGANQDNSLQNLPRSILMMQLLDVSTGLPLAYMSANILSAMRTGGVSGLYARYFAKKNSSKIAVIGPGVIGRYSFDGVIQECSNISEINIFGRGDKSKEQFKKHCLSKGFSINDLHDCFSIDEACYDADVIITSSSQAYHFCDYPLIPKNIIKKGACVIVTSAIRIDRFYSDYDIIKCQFVADDKRLYMENRGIDAKPETPDDDMTVTVKGAISERILNGKFVYNLPEIVNDSKFIRDEDTIFFCASSGIPIEDVSWAYECYQNALNNNIGQILTLWEESHL